MNIQNVSEFPATAPEQIEHFAALLSKSEQGRAVFWEICRGHAKTPKSAEEIGKRVDLPAKRVLEIAGPLAAHQLFEKLRHGGRICYRKYPNINAVKHKIMRLAKDRAKLASHVTVRNPRAAARQIVVKITRNATDVYADVRALTIDEVDNFSRVRSLRHNRVPNKLSAPRLPEKVFKYGVARILGNRGKFSDWGGEKSDLYTSHLRIRGRRYFSAIGFKGPATKGILTPGKMGHNGDQIQRLFESDSQVFLVQYEGQIAQSVIDQLKGMAVNKSVQDRRTVFYGVLALEDSYRLRIRYAKEFKAAAKLPVA
jgi:hypothetical protein